MTNKFLNWFSRPLTSYSSILLILNNKLQEEDVWLDTIIPPIYSIIFCGYDMQAGKNRDDRYSTGHSEPPSQIPG